MRGLRLFYFISLSSESEAFLCSCILVYYVVYLSVDPLRLKLTGKWANWSPHSKWLQPPKNTCITRGKSFSKLKNTESLSRSSKDLNSSNFSRLKAPKRRRRTSTLVFCAIEDYSGRLITCAVLMFSQNTVE